MRYRNNLSNTSNNTFFKVTSSFDVFVAVGHAPSNSFYGSSQIFGTVYRKVTLTPGDEIHDLCGGVFVVTGGVAYAATMKIDEKGAFERSYGSVEEQWPTDNIEVSATRKEVAYPSKLPTIEPGTRVGHGIHTLAS
jgi:hypothetical protein